MKQYGDLSILMSLALGASMTLGCGDDAAPASSSTPGGSGGQSVVAGGTSAIASAGTAGSSTTAGSSAQGGSGGGSSAGSSSGGAAGGGLGTVGNGGSSSGGAAGGSGGSGGSGGAGADPMPFGPVTCSPVFETACKPQIHFTNGDPNGRGKVFAELLPNIETTMQDITCTVCSIIYRDPDEIPQNKRWTEVTLDLNEYDGVAATGGGKISFSLNYIEGQSGNKPRAKTEFLGVLLHEAVHLYQNYGTGGTGEGMADYVRIRVGYYEPGRRGPGGSWHDAYTTSGFFYSWLAGPCQYHQDSRAMHDVNIGYLINKTLGQNGDPFANVSALFEQEFGKSADALWTEYQAAIE